MHYSTRPNDIKKQYSDGRIDVDDMIQEGCLGLMEAVRHFDTSRGTKFLSYAVFWIRKFMREAANVLTASAETISLDAIVDDEGHTELYCTSMRFTVSQIPQPTVAA